MHTPNDLLDPISVKPIIIFCFQSWEGHESGFSNFTKVLIWFILFFAMAYWFSFLFFVFIFLLVFKITEILNCSLFYQEILRSLGMFTIVLHKNSKKIKMFTICVKRIRKN